MVALARQNSSLTFYSYNSQPSYGEIIRRINFKNSECLGGTYRYPPRSKLVFEWAPAPVTNLRSSYTKFPDPSDGDETGIYINFIEVIDVRIKVFHRPYTQIHINC